ncbi:hypothetical protein [Kitasatospora phosalacinea]|uniref:hypothetical protein n=1 Tax=Kitasatospora phosalacinea TaxID=2065 RepID=UPI000525F16E|nr:hypothetical protein [Kitasatospora phosalacinea]
MIRPVAVLWSLLLAALLALLPCAASARTLNPPAPAPGHESHGASARPGPGQAPAGTTPGRATEPVTESVTEPTAGTAAGTAARPAVAVRTVAGTPAPSHRLPVAADVPGAELILCAAEGPGPVPGHGCSSHPFCGPESHLPNAPPQPGTADRPQLVAPPVTPAASARAVPTGSHHAPDLHVLQVHRS